MANNPDGWALTDKGRRAALLLVRFYVAAWLVTLALALAVGFAIGWWVHGF